MKNNFKKQIVLSALLLMLTSFTACGPSTPYININGTYKSNNVMNGYEAVVENGEITIYSISPFNTEVYWYGTCNQSDLDANNKLVSKKIQTARDRDWFFSDFGFGFGKSGAYEKEIEFTENSLTFIYDMSGMAISQETLYKEVKRITENDSNAKKADPNYVEPSKPLPHEIPRGVEPSTERPTENETEPKLEGSDKFL